MPDTPALLIARVSRPITRKLVRDLSDASAVIAREIIRLSNRPGIGAEFRRAQLRLVRSEINVVLDEVWSQEEQEIRASERILSEAAATAQGIMEERLFRAAGRRIPDALLEAERIFARSAILNYFSRGDNGISLSRKVYRSRALARGWVDRAINRVLLRGGSWRDLSLAVRGMINPNTPGGVSYAAKRLARTELNNAFHSTQIKLAEQNPWVDKMKWNLSRSHPRPDNCDGLSDKTFSVRDTPSRPHPQCLCYVTAVPISEKEFIDNLVAGNYEDVSERYLRAAGDQQRLAG